MPNAALNRARSGRNAARSAITRTPPNAVMALLDPEFWRRDIARRSGQAAQGMASGMLGAPVDLATMAMRVFGYDVPNEQIVGNTDWWGRKMGADPNTAPFIAGSVGPVPDAMDAGRVLAALDPRVLNAVAGLAGMTAFHGSPSRFDKFDITKIGTGEGAQAYGHGLYFAENKRVAEGYRAALSPGSGGDAQDVAVRVLDAVGGDEQKALREIEGRLARGNMPVNADSPLVQAHRLIKRGLVNRGGVYEVDIPDEAIDRMLDWDKPLSEQPESVQKGLGQLLGGDDPLLAELYSGGIRAEDIGVTDRSPGGQIYNTLAERFGGQEQMSRKLNEAGIPGIRYLDQGSRTAGEGTSNFVVFDDSIVKILSRE